MKDLITHDTAKLPSSTKAAFLDFWDNTDTLEKIKNVSPIIFQDAKSSAYYIECHIQASLVVPLLDVDAVLDPEEQIDYRANRSMQPQHRAFQQMLKDAEKGR